MFTPCADCERDKTMFHWRTVACSLECAKVYFAKVEAARNPANKIEISNIDIEEKENKEVVNIDVNDTTIVENSIKQKRSKRYSNLKNEEESEQIE